MQCRSCWDQERIAFLERELEEANAQLGTARGELSTARMLLSVYDESVPRLKGELEEAKKDVVNLFHVGIGLKKQMSECKDQLSSHKAALDRVEAHLKRHTQRCDWARHRSDPFGLCCCPFDDRIETALTALTDLKTPCEP